MKTTNKLLSLMAMALMVIGFTTCGDKDEDEVHVSVSEISFSIEGGEKSFDVSSNTNWMISNKPAWITLDRENGKGEKTVNVTVQKNNETSERTVSLLIIAGEAEARITIRQEGREAVVNVNPTSLTFEAKKGDSKTFSITSDRPWTIVQCPTWLMSSTNSGNGTSTVTLTTSSSNDTSEVLTGEVVVSDGEKTATVTVTQTNGRTPDCTTTVDNILRMSDDICYNYKCGSNVKFFYDRLFVTASMKLRTESEIIASVQQETDMWSRTSASDAAQPAWYGPKLSPGTNYTVVTVSYDMNDRIGEITKTEIKTKTSVNQPEVNATRLYFKGSGYNSYYGVEVQKGENGYCSKYYVWAAAGELQTTWMFSDAPSVLAWYLKREIAKNGTSHATNINSQTDALLASQGYTFKDGSPIASSGREYLEGPMSQELATFEKLRHVSDDESIQIVAWGMDADGEFSGKMFSYLANLSDFSTTRAARLRRDAPHTQSTATSFKPKHLSSSNGFAIITPWR